MIWICVMYAGFAGVFTLSKAALAVASPLFFLGARMFFSGLLMTCYSFWNSPVPIRLSKEKWFSLFGLALTGVYLANALEFWGMQWLSSIKTCFFYSLSPFIAALFAYYTIEERLTSYKWAGLAAAFVSVIPLFLAIEDQSSSESGLWAEAALTVAVITSVYGWILLKKIVNIHHMDPIFANGISMLIGGSTALLHSFLVESWDPLPVRDVSSFLILLLSLMLLSNLFCYNLYGYLLKRFSATLLSFAGFTTQIFSALYGSFFLGEFPPRYFYFSMLLGLLGLFLFYKEELSREVALQR